MKQLFIILLFLFGFCKVFSQETNYKEYSYTEFFELIEQETDTVFEMNDAVVRYNEKTDSLFVVKEVGNDFITSRKAPLIVDKEIKLNNVHFLSERVSSTSTTTGAIGNVRFKKKVTFLNMINAVFYHCIFDKFLRHNSWSDNNIQNTFDDIEITQGTFTLNHCILKESLVVGYRQNKMDLSKSFIIEIENCDIYLNQIEDKTSFGEFYVLGRNIRLLRLNNNRIYNEGEVHIRILDYYHGSITKNNFGDAYTRFVIPNRQTDFMGFIIEDNLINKAVLLRVNELTRDYTIPIQQFKGQLISEQAMLRFVTLMIERNGSDWARPKLDDPLIDKFNVYKIKDQKIYDAELSFKAQVHSHYKALFNNRDANIVYVETKDLETDRSEYLYRESPSFKKFFTWKINQFLKVFSNYGTEPAKAVIFSLYVILFFALIYLFFPNSWDKHGRRRIMDRYRFFTKYMKREAGINEVYLEEQRQELLESEDFKQYMLKSKQQIPRFFIATAIPLYQWSVLGTKLWAALLKRGDIMRGSWSELPQSRRFWKSVLLISAFLVAIVYDLLIKILNALMLSINTFTTLGFGEIPIRGLPRYLAIIQGFIGWFMLTIFSVSLISQLLN